MSKKILITAITGFRNHGVEALARSIVAGIREYCPDAEIDVLTQDPAYDSAVGANLNVNFIDDPWRPNKNAFKRALVSRIARYIPQLDNRGSFIGKYDMVVVSGGDMFGPDYGNFDPDLMPLRECQKQGIPYVFIGQSIGQFRDAEEARSFVEVAGKAARIYLRESISLKYLKDGLSLPSSILAEAPDPAFMLPVAENSKQLRSSILGNETDRYITMSVSQGVTGFAGVGDSKHVEALVRVVDYFTEVQNLPVVLIPHVAETYHPNDDGLCALKVLKRSANPGMVKIAPNHLSASEYKAIVADSEFLLAERMHAAIGGLSTTVPVFCIGYSIKYRGILGDLFGDSIADNELLISVGDFVESDAVPEVLVNAWTSRSQYQAILVDKIPKVKEATRSCYSFVNEF
jgi:colanic acid/amylovoran biosynthesis protein